MPANWQGWCTFLGGLALIIALGIKVMGMTEGYSFATRFVALNAVIFAGVGAICLIAFRKGRPSP
jgi:multisubunit Na+/H+ antiporter MnhF subunit